MCNQKCNKMAIRHINPAPRDRLPLAASVCSGNVRLAASVRSGNVAVRACAALWIIIVTVLLLNFCHNNNNGDAFDHGYHVFLSNTEVTKIKAFISFPTESTGIVLTQSNKSVV